ncbi:DEKNAAC103895 [Brettanomyces naardenensis]|uniref:DEKNAAC103895 n=1 Tax=Brettanomyces naardenensis TaxID=13370 RepID=A0A448YPF1_BRENA|nr:DEKNAAC103895 [Brettanomyces naardenensis]
MLKQRSKFYFITAPPAGEKVEVDLTLFLMNDYSIAGSAPGGPLDIQYTINFVAQKTKRWVETIDINEENVSTARKGTADDDVKFRFVPTRYDKYLKD